MKPRSPTLQADSLPAEPQGKPKNTGMGSLFLLQGIFQTQESNRGLLHYRQVLYQWSYQGSLILYYIIYKTPTFFSWVFGTHYLLFTSSWKQITTAEFGTKNQKHKQLRRSQLVLISVIFMKHEYSLVLFTNSQAIPVGMLVVNWSDFHGIAHRSR